MKDRKPTGRAAAAQRTLKAMRKLDADAAKKAAAKRNEERIARQARRQALLHSIDQYVTDANAETMMKVTVQLDEDALDALLAMCHAIHEHGYKEGEHDEEIRAWESEER